MRSFILLLLCVLSSSSIRMRINNNCLQQRQPISVIVDKSRKLLSENLGSINKHFLSGLFIASIACANPACATEFNKEWTDRNRLAAEAWRTVDDLMYDRTFNGMDWFRLRQDIVLKSYKSDEEVYTSIKEMLLKLGDKYTRYLTPAQYSALINSAQGELTGVGIQLLGDDNVNTIITSVENDSPAATSGLMKGDVILNVDGSNTQDISPEEVAALLRGKSDTKASIRVSRNDKILDFSIIRKPFKLSNVNYSLEKIKNKNVGIIRIKSFSSTTNAEVTKAMEYFNGEADVIVLDLRNNGGGLLQAAVEISNLFLSPGKIVTFVVNKEGLSEAQMTVPSGVKSNNVFLPDINTKIYILVNKDTASAAEVFSAALKENNRALIIGEKTFGKGVIQTLSELRQGGISVTIAKYETPNHNNINKVGIPVDKSVNCNDDLDIKMCLSDLI